MNKELEEKFLKNPTLFGYKSLVKAIERCDKEVSDAIIDEYNAVISNVDSKSL